MKKSLAIVLVLMLVIIAFTGCSKKKEDVKITVRVPILTMNTLNDPQCRDTSDFLKKAFAAFAEKYDKYNVSADVIVFEQTDYQANIPDKYGKSDGTDLTYGGYFTISGYMYDGYAIPLDDMITDAIRADFSESSWAQSQGNNGKTYLMPFFALQNVLSYNTDLFKACGLEKYCYDDNKIRGWSLEEWDIILSTLTEKLPAGTYPMMMYGANNQGDTHTMLMSRCKGSEFFDENGLFHLNTPEGIAGLEWFKQNQEKGYYPPYCGDLVINDCQELFVNGQLAIFVYNTALQVYADQMNLNFVNFPGYTAKGTNTNWITGFMAFDNGDAKKVEVVKDFLKYVYETPEWLDYCTTGIPCSKSVMERYNDKIEMGSNFLANEAYSVDFTAGNPNWADVREAYWPHIHALLNGTETAEQAAAGIDADCNAVINACVKKLHE